MRIIFKISRIINIIGLLFLIFGPYGIAVTGLLQFIAAIFFLIAFPRNHHIYIYFIMVGLFFMFWNNNVFHWQLLIPLGLLVYLSYLIHFQKKLSQ